MSTPVVKTITLRTDDTLVDENNQEIPVETIVHCLGALKSLVQDLIMMLEKLMMKLILLIQNISVN